MLPSDQHYSAVIMDKSMNDHRQGKMHQLLHDKLKGGCEIAKDIVMEGVQRDRAYSNNLFHKTRLESLDQIEKLKNATEKIDGKD